MAALTNAERQAAFRARKAAGSANEVRGVFAHPDDHAALRDAAARLTRRRAKGAKGIPRGSGK